MSRVAASVTITDPLVKYHSLIATGVCHPDAAQYRLAHHLQRLYLRLKDYAPAQENRVKLHRVAQAVNKAKPVQGHELASPSHPIRRNPLFARFFRKSADVGGDGLALTKVLTSHQAALTIDSPKGLFLSGEVGIGKSMLLDLLAEGLPTAQKRRWHFNTFMLHAISKLEQFRRDRHQVSEAVDEYSLLWVAKELVEKSPILFLDEFQLPDRAASKIMNNLFIAFFQLGGVLIASSNRIPEELEKAIGGYYHPPSTGGLLGQMLGMGRQQLSGELFGQTSDFAAFLEVLKSRCDFYHMEGTHDWRRRESLVEPQQLSRQGSNIPYASTGVTAGEHLSEVMKDSRSQPVMYFLTSSGEDAWGNGLRLPPNLSNWQPASFMVYGREVHVPRQQKGVTYWDFAGLVSSFGPADYLTLTSNYHTFIIDRVPVLLFSMKNEARRFITLLDALYESRCKLIIRAEAGPDDLFFPEMRQNERTDTRGKESVRDEAGDATYSETIAEVFQDQMSPFRPNVSTYSESKNAKYDPDQDSDFKVEPDRRIDFGKTSAFTGKDERFAYKRATSRLWELCSAEWHARTGDWWQPLPRELRHWETSNPSKPLPHRHRSSSRSEITMGPSVEVEEPVGMERFRIAAMKNRR